MIYKLPEFVSSAEALEPYLNSWSVSCHQRHHQEDVARLNALIAAPYRGDERYLENLLRNISQFDEVLRYSAGAYFNHHFFWPVLSTRNTCVPGGALGKTIIRQFGGVGALKDLMFRQAAQWFGSGWLWLLLRYNGTLAVSTTPNNDNPLMDVNLFSQGYPLFGIDLWEHAYYIQYQDRREDYLTGCWTVLDWAAIDANYEKAKAKIANWNTLR